MHSNRRACFIVAMMALCIGIGACGGSPRTVSGAAVTDHTDSAFDNFLVIGVAHDYEGRAMFERKLAKQLRSHGVDATAYYSIIGGNKPIDRASIEALVQAEGYDAVLISRVLNRDTDASVKAGPAGAKAVRKDGRPINLFRYDYEELNEPMMLNINLNVTLSTELFSTASEDMVWNIKSKISGKEMMEELVDEAVDIIDRRLRREGLIAGQ